MILLANAENEPSDWQLKTFEKIDMRKYNSDYKFDADKFFQQMEERYGSYDSGMSVFRRDTEFFRQRQTFSYEEQGSPKCL